MFETKMAAEGAKRRPRGASGGGLFLALFFEPTFESNLGPNGEGALPGIFTLLPPLTLSPLVLPLKGTPSHEPSSAQALSGTCKGKADRKVPKDIIGKSRLDLLGFARRLLGCAWTCLGLLGLGLACLACLGLLGVACVLLGLLGLAWVCLGLLGFALVCLWFA